MFRELMNYCITATSSSGVYSLALQHSSVNSSVILSFWAGNVFHRVCLGSSPRGILLPRKVLNLLSSFLSLFDIPPTCIALIGMGEKLDDCLSATLPGTRKPCVVNTFGEIEFDASLALPTAQIIERHDYRTILDFLLMKLRLAVDRDWLQSLPTLYQVPYASAYFRSIFHRTQSLFLSSVCSGLNTRYQRRQSSLRNSQTTGITSVIIWLMSPDCQLTGST